MANFFKSSIGQKFLMSITGLFLIVFLCVHLLMNLLLLFDSSGNLYNEGAHFMATNPLIRIVEPVLALGFILHIVYATILTLQNQSARPVAYEVSYNNAKTTWASRNMWILGGLVFCFLIIHILDFFWKMKFGNVASVNIKGVEMEDAFALVSGKFKTLWWLDLIYVVGAIFLGLHLHHAFWSAFQTLGLNNAKWRKRLEVIGDVYTYFVAGCFAIIPLYFLFLK